MEGGERREKEDEGFGSLVKLGEVVAAAAAAAPRAVCYF